MKTKVPAEAFLRAAAQKRKQSKAEAGGSKKKPRSGSPPAPPSVTRTPVPSPPPYRSRTPTPPPQRPPTPLPPRRSPTPLPQSEPLNPTEGAPIEESRAPNVQPTQHPESSANQSAPTEAPQTSRGASTGGRQETVVSQGVRIIASEPAGEKMGPVPVRPSLMNNPHLAEQLLSVASIPAIQEEIHRTHSRTVFQECEAALLRVVNVFHHTQARIGHWERRVNGYRREALECRTRAAEAEDALKLSRAGEAERLEIVRSHARAESEASLQQMRNAIERALTAEEKQAAAEAKLADTLSQLEAVKSELKVAEEKIEIAEEVSRLADIRVAEATASVKAADKRAADAELVAQAAEKKAAESTEKAVEGYLNSPAFVEEVAQAGADAFLHGFDHCRSKAMRVFGLEGLQDLEPDEDNEEGEIDQESAPADEAAPPANASPANN